ncbi:MAG: hypothetical protein QOJ25_705 [Solirubrobacteraceae bacterium]|jgi:hypothetical protein|nr:hypothetical protein [Solirubrobacteraceae bacterium]
MTAVCPNGHISATLDWCDTCGDPIEAASPPASDLASISDEVDTSPATRREPCPLCLAPRSGDDRYCEGCGYDFLARAAPAAEPSDEGSGATVVATWEAIVSADRQQFDALGNQGIEFPAGRVERRYPLTLELVRIGRSRGRAGEEIPEIDLTGADADPGASHLHAALERQDDGAYALRDLGSTNGTTVNDDPAPVSKQVTRPLADGDRIRLGAWTTVTLRRV